MHHMVFQKRAPRLGWWFRLPARNQAGHRSLGDLNSQLGQFAMNSRGAPERVGLHHLQNKAKDFRVGRRPPGAFASGLELPEQPEPLSMPPNDSFGFDDDQRLLPIGPKRESKTQKSRSRLRS